MDSGERVLCHECGRAYRLLASHARQAHGLGAQEYRERWGLNRSTSLAAPELLAARAEEGRRRWDRGVVREGLAVGQEMARSGELLALSHAVQQPGAGRRERRVRIAETTAAHRERVAAAARRRVDARLAELGFEDFGAYWQQRYVQERMPVKYLREELGVGQAVLDRLLVAAGSPARRTPGGAGPAAARWSERPG